MAAKRNSARIAIVIPAYNEAESIAQVIREVQHVFGSSAYTYTIVVVDDGSKDATAQLALDAGVHVIRHIINIGSGGATATGLSYAQQHGYTMAATLDADGQHHAEDVLKGVRLMGKGKHDLLIGSRLVVNAGMSRTKRLGNKGLSFITYLLFGVNTTDSQSGLRIFSTRALDKLKWKTSGYEFCSEMLWRAKQQKLDIGEYPVQAIYTDYSKAKGQNNWNAFNIVKSLVRRRIVEIIGE